MKMLGTSLCINCREAEEMLRAEGIEYEYTDFTDSIEVLKEFIRFRDSHKEFESAKADGKIGIPCFVFENDELTFDVKEAIEKAKHS